MKKDDLALIASLLSVVIASVSAYFAWQANEIARDANTPNVRLSLAPPAKPHALTLRTCFEKDRGYGLFRFAEVDALASNLGGRPISVVKVSATSNNIPVHEEVYTSYYASMNPNAWTSCCLDDGVNPPFDLESGVSRQWRLWGVNFVLVESLEKLQRIYSSEQNMNIDMTWVVETGDGKQASSNITLTAFAEPFDTSVNCFDLIKLIGK